MKKFDLNGQIKKWRLQLQKLQGLELGQIEELECSLRDRIDDYVENGFDIETAFKKAVDKTIDNPIGLADEFYKVHAISGRKAPWRRRQSIMFLLPNFAKVAFRNISRNRTYSSLNFLGLTIGLLCAGMVFLYINYELSYDTFHNDPENIYRVARNYRSQGYSLMSFDGYNSATNAQMTQLKGIENIAGITDACQFFVFDNEEYLYEQGREADALITTQILQTNTPTAFFNIFNWQFLTGSVEMLSTDYYKVVLTNSEAIKLFGNNWLEQNILEKKIIVQDSTYQIAGVIEDIPANSHFSFNLLLYKHNISYWGARIYIRTDGSSKPQTIEQRINDNKDIINANMAKDELFDKNFLQPLTAIHLHSDILYELKPPGDIAYLYIFGLVAIVILLLTISNYTNLSIALNANRLREIGMRKLMGARKQSIIFQFAFESIFITLLALPLVFLSMELILPLFNQFMDVDITNKFLTDWRYFLLILLGAFSIGLLSGVYPAFYLSSFNILKLFSKKGIQANGNSKLSVRKLIITFQFVLLIGLTSTTYLINQQLTYLNNKDLGFHRERVLYLDLSRTGYPLFKQRASSIPEIEVIGSGIPLGRNPYNQVTYKFENESEVFDDAYELWMNKNAIKAYGIQTTIDPRYSKTNGSTERFVLINETTVNKLLELYDTTKEGLIGKRLITEPEYTQSDGTVGFPKTIIGFFDDINIFSLREEVEPYFLNVTEEGFVSNTTIIKFNSDDISELVASISQIYQDIDEEGPIKYSFMDENLKALYKSEIRVGELTVLLSTVAFIIALLGLISVTALLTTLRKKEVGIRKVLGATTTSIIFNFNREYIKLIVIALCIAAPLAYLGIESWLENFAFKISPSPFIFISISIAILITALVAVSAITYRTAMNNPINSLRDDQ